MSDFGKWREQGWADAQYAMREILRSEEIRRFLSLKAWEKAGGVDDDGFDTWWKKNGSAQFLMDIQTLMSHAHFCYKIRVNFPECEWRSDTQ